MLKEVEALAESIRKHGLDPEFMERMETRVRHSGILVDGKQYVPYSAIPVFFNDDDMEFLNLNTGILHSILSKMTGEYIRNPEYRKVFGFSPDMEELITLPCNYGEMFPVMRYDIFLFPDSGDFQLCEINTDGTSGFDLDCRVSGALIDTYSESGGQYDLPPHMDNFHTAGTLADSLIRIYFSSENPVFFSVDHCTELCGCCRVRTPYGNFRLCVFDQLYYQLDHDCHYDCCQYIVLSGEGTIKKSGIPFIAGMVGLYAPFNDWVDHQWRFQLDILPV